MPSQWRRVIFGPWGSKTLEPIQLDLTCVIMSTVPPHTQNMVAAVKECGGEMGVFYFGSLNTPTIDPETCGFLLNAPKCFSGGCVPLGLFWLGG